MRLARRAHAAEPPPTGGTAPGSSAQSLAAATAASFEPEPDGRATVVFPVPEDVAPPAPLARAAAAPARSAPAARVPHPPAARPPAPGPQLARAETNGASPGAVAAAAPNGAPPDPLAAPAPNGAPPGRRGTAADHVELDEIYEQVLERLRRDLVVERERVGHLVGTPGWGI